MTAVFMLESMDKTRHCRAVDAWARASIEVPCAGETMLESMSVTALPIAPAPAAGLRLLEPAGERAIAWHEGRIVGAAEFLDDIARIAAASDARGPLINLCADRYDFLAAFGAALLRGQTTLLPASRAPAVVD